MDTASKWNMIIMLSMIKYWWTYKFAFYIVTNWLTLAYNFGLKSWICFHQVQYVQKQRHQISRLKTHGHLKPLSNYTKLALSVFTHSNLFHSQYRNPICLITINYYKLFLLCHFHIDGDFCFLFAVLFSCLWCAVHTPCYLFMWKPKKKWETRASPKWKWYAWWASIYY